MDLGRLREVFLEELEEHLATLQGGLLELERDPAAEQRIVPELFRAAHSLKGGAQALRLPVLADCCHRLEDLLADLRAGEVPLTRATHDALLQNLDVLAAIADELASPPVPAAADDPSGGPDGTVHAEDTPSRHDPPRPPVTPKPPATRTSAAAGATRAHRPALRVPAERMDALLDRASDVLLARDRLAHVAREVRQLADVVTRTERRWHDLGLGPGAGGHTTAATGPGTVPAQAWRETRERVEALRTETIDTARLLEDTAGGLEHTTRSLRLQPFRTACDGLERAVRDLTHGTSDRAARLLVDGGDVELDGDVVAALREPLLHLVRNAVVHGVEPAATRRQAGKPEAGTVRVSAQVLGDRVEVRVADDGAGLDLAALRARATAGGIDADDGDEGALRLAWLPGLSTAATPDELAGRGVGLDAVRNRIELLGGGVELASEPGHGCTVSLHLPVTLTTLHVLIVRVGSQTVALPSAAVQTVVRLPSSAIRSAGGRTVAVVGDEHADVVALRTVLGLDRAPANEHHLGVLVATTDGPTVLVVDEIVDAQRVTRRQLHPRLTGAPGVLGATLLPTGDTALVINPLAVAREQNGPAFDIGAEAPASAERATQVLLAEDSATTRALERDILERAGYDVRVATDGSQAWQLLREHGADLVVSDVEMPGMDGFALCAAIRDHPRFAQVPVVLVTSRATDEDRHRGVEAGANAYLVKGAFDQANFLATLGRLL